MRLKRCIISTLFLNFCDSEPEYSINYIHINSVYQQLVKLLDFSYKFAFGDFEPTSGDHFDLAIYWQQDLGLIHKINTKDV